MTGTLLRPAQWDTSSDQQVSVSLDVGVVPQGYTGAGQYIITSQIWPIPDRKTADRIAAAVREALQARLGITMNKQEGIG